LRREGSLSYGGNQQMLAAGKRSSNTFGTVCCDMLEAFRETITGRVYLWNRDREAAREAAVVDLRRKVFMMRRGVIKSSYNEMSSPMPGLTKI
jgi:hypothetical protein